MVSTTGKTGQGSIYSKRSGLVLGFHGTDEQVAREIVLNRQPMRFSNNAWDWIGHGVYFWEYSPSRAMEFAITASKRKNSSIMRPAVIGAVLDLGYCLDLLDYENLLMLKTVNAGVKHDPKFVQLANAAASNGGSGDMLLRRRDCAIIEHLHEIRAKDDLPPFDSVKAVF